jgi:hypothetical protein
VVFLKRFHIKPGGFISKVFKNINPKDVEIFSNVFELNQKSLSKFKVVSGSDIKKYYPLFKTCQ